MPSKKSMAAASRWLRAATPAPPPVPPVKLEAMHARPHTKVIAREGGGAAGPSLATALRQRQRRRTAEGNAPTVMTTTTMMTPSLSPSPLPAHHTSPSVDAALIAARTAELAAKMEALHAEVHTLRAQRDNVHSTLRRNVADWHKEKRAAAASSTQQARRQSSPPRRTLPQLPWVRDDEGGVATVETTTSTMPARGSLEWLLERHAQEEGFESVAQRTRLRRRTAHMAPLIDPSLVDPSVDRALMEAASRKVGVPLFPSDDARNRPARRRRAGASSRSKSRTRMTPHDAARLLRDTALVGGGGAGTTTTTTSGTRRARNQAAACGMQDDVLPAAKRARHDA